MARDCKKCMYFQGMHPNYNKLIELKKEFCEKFKDIELEIDK